MSGPDGPPLPRGLLLLACLWIIGSWLVAIGPQPPVQPSASSYTPGVRAMLMSLVAGLSIAWPLLRLSQAPTPWPCRLALLDLVTLVALVQVVVWPLRLVTPWSVQRTLLIDLSLVSWTALVGALLAATLHLDRRARTIAMAAWLILAVGTPALASFAPEHDAAPAVTLARLGAFTSVHALAEGGPFALRRDDWIPLLYVAVAAAAAWCAVGLLAVAGRRASATADSRRVGA